MNKQLLSLTAVGALLFSVCGGDSSSDDATGSATTGAAADTTVTTASTTGAPTTSTAPAATAATSASSAGTAAGGATAAGVAVKLVEWSLTAPTTLTAGPQTFTVTNDGEFAHEFVIMKGTYEALPQSPIGAVLEDELAPGTVVAETPDRIDSGSAATVSADLAAGPYVLLCNIASGPNSHAGKGQRLNITVS